MNSPKSDLLRETHRTGIRFLLAEIETGLNFVSLADSASPNNGRERHLRKAREVYFIVLRLLSRVDTAPDEKLKLDAKMGELRIRLIAAGCRLETLG